MTKKNFFTIFICVMILIIAAGVFIQITPGVVKKFSFLNFLNTQEQNREFYSQALSFEKKGEYKKAYDTYQLVSGTYAAYEGGLFHQAQCLEKLSDERGAEKKYKQLLFERSKSKLVPVTRYRLGQLYMRQKKYAQAEKEFDVLIKKYPHEKYSIGAYYYLGIAEKEKNPEKSRAYFFEYLKESPSGIFAGECIKELSKYSSGFSRDENLYYGAALYHANSYKEAIPYLTAAATRNSWYYKVKAFYGAGENMQSFAVIENGLTNYASYLSEKELKEMMNLYVRLDNRSALMSWSHLAEITSGKKSNDYALYNRALRESDISSLKTYKIIADKYPYGDYASESLWKLFFDRYKKGDYVQALEFASLHIDRYKNTKASPAVLFWCGKIKEKMNKKKEAVGFYRRVISDYPDSYYALRAFGRKSSIEGKKDFMWKSAYFENIDEELFVDSMKQTAQELKSKYGNFIAELAVVDDFDTILLIDDKDKIFLSLSALKKGQGASSCFYARTYIDEVSQKPDKKSIIWLLGYPIHYAERINNSARYHKIDPYLVIALMREESHFNPSAISSANAYGLMQILPGTANDVAKWNKLPPVVPAELLNPDTNIRFSTTYLSFLKNKFNGNMAFAVASYNGGYGSVQRWIDKNDYNQDIDEFVENIPYPETQNYVKKVFGSYWNYMRIYNR